MLGTVADPGTDERVTRDGAVADAIFEEKRLADG